MTPTDAKPVDALIPPLRGTPQRAKGKIESGHASEKEKKKVITRPLHEILTFATALISSF